MTPSFRSFLTGAVHLLAIFLIVGTLSGGFSKEPKTATVGISEDALPIAIRQPRELSKGKGKGKSKGKGKGESSVDCVTLGASPAPSDYGKGGKGGNGKGSSSEAPVSPERSSTRRRLFSTRGVSRRHLSPHRRRRLSTARKLPRTFPPISLRRCPPDRPACRRPLPSRRSPRSARARERASRARA